MASNITVDTLTKGSTTLNTDEIVDTNSNQICKAWVNFNGQGTIAIRDSYNVSSITDGGTGEYVINFSNTMANSNYSISGIAGHTSSSGDRSRRVTTHTVATSSLRINTTYSLDTYVDVPLVSVQVFGD